MTTRVLFIVTAAVSALSIGCNGRSSEHPAVPPGSPEATQTRPQFDPRGERILAVAGEAGARRIVSMSVDGSDVEVLSAGPDDIDPTWLPDKSGFVFASQRVEGNGFDLFLQNVEDGRTVGEPRALTNGPGDDLQPAVSPLEYTFHAVHSDGCSETGAGGYQLDRYRKIAFTRRVEGDESVWFVSDNGLHEGQLSQAQAQCSHPAWAGDGLSLAWRCDDADQATVLDGAARWDQSFAEALSTLDEGTAPSCDDEPHYDWEPDDDDDQAAGWDKHECLATLPRRYAGYVGTPVAAPGTASVAYSANRTLLMAAGDGEIRLRSRAGGDWSPLAVTGDDPANPVWSPDGTQVAYDAVVDGRRQIQTQATDLYLQDVTNLGDFPELWGAGESGLLAANHFVVRDGVEREFHTLYDQLNYGRRPQFVTADALLQGFSDELLRLLKDAESRAADDLTVVSAELMAAFASPKTPSEVFLQRYFTTAWVFLEASSRVEMPSSEDYLYMGDIEFMTPEERAELEERMGPAGPKMAKQALAVVAELDPAIAEMVREDVERALAHEGLIEVAVPGYPDPFKVDFSQFKPRGHYAQTGLDGYFMAMSWFSLVPLPLDESLIALTDAIGAIEAPAGTAPAYGSTLVDMFDEEKRRSGATPPTPTTTGQRIALIDRAIGSFMGRPVDATLSHVQSLRAKSPKLFSPFESKKLQAELLALRGPVPLRGADGAISGGSHPLRVSFMPKRLGYDVTLLSALTHPKVEGRGQPSAADVFAAMGIERAATHVDTGAAGQPWASSLTEAVQVLAAQDPSTSPHWTEDIYHGWLATTLELASPTSPDAGLRLHFADTDAWHDRLLSSALGGYTQLKHAAVLYAMQDMGVQCDSARPVYVLVEMPVLPMPRGYVDPAPEVFDAIAQLADRVYIDLNLGEAPWPWSVWEDSDVHNVGQMALRLAEISRKELAGEVLTADDYRFIVLTGTYLETIFVGMGDTGFNMPAGDATRVDRGIAIAADIHTNVTSNQALTVALGRVDDIYVLVPRSPDAAQGAVGREVTQGGVFSFYEFWQPMSERLTDDQWNAKLSADPPARPTWTKSFLEPRVGTSPK